MNQKLFDRFYKKYYEDGKIIQRIARKYSHKDEELYNDLVQEALLKLWRLNPKKAKTNLDSWVRNAVRNACIDYLRHNRPKLYESLDARLMAGEQIEHDDATGTLRMISYRVERSLDVEPRYKPQLEEEEEPYD